jgi:hypothetical protein
MCVSFFWRSEGQTGASLALMMTRLFNTEKRLSNQILYHVDFMYHVGMPLSGTFFHSCPAHPWPMPHPRWNDPSLAC